MASSVSLSVFAREMNSLANIVAGNIPKLQAQVAQNVVNHVALETPVLTGQASGNWKTSIDAPDTSYDAGPNPEGGTKSAKMARAVLPSLQLGQTVYISNNVPYIVDLNNGSSAKAPQNFVETATIDALHRSANFNLLIT